MACSSPMRRVKNRSRVRHTTARSASATSPCALQVISLTSPPRTAIVVHQVLDRERRVVDERVAEGVIGRIPMLQPLAHRPIPALDGADGTHTGAIDRAVHRTDAPAADTAEVGNQIPHDLQGRGDGSGAHDELGRCARPDAHSFVEIHRCRVQPEHHSLLVVHARAQVVDRRLGHAVRHEDGLERVDPGRVVLEELAGPVDRERTTAVGHAERERGVGG